MNINKRADGRFSTSVQHNGRRRFIYGKTEKEVRDKAREIEKTILMSNTIPSPGKRTVADLLDAWLASADLRPKTLNGYRQTLALILPALGKLRLAKLQPEHLQQLYADVGRTSKRTAYRAHLMLHRAGALAVLWGWLAVNPAERVVKPRYRAERKQVWMAEQLRDFLAGTEASIYGPLWTLAACTGCRLGELLGLRWQDVDTTAGTVAVTGSLQYVAGKWVQSAPKTRAGRRTIALPSEGLAALRRQKVQQNASRLRAGAKWEDTAGLVFTSPNGRPVQQTWVQNAMQAECHRLGLPKLTPHQIRHTHCSLLLANGLPVPAVAERMGHANPAVTLAIYGHAIGGSERQAVEAISRALAK